MIFVNLQKKLEGELTQIEEKHDTKKRKFMDSSDQFHEQLKKVNFVNSPGDV